MKQIMKGWVTVPNKWWQDDDTVYLYKNKNHANEWDNDRDIRSFVFNSLVKLGFTDKSTQESFEMGENAHFVEENISIQIYSSDKRESLESIKKKVVLDSMGLLQYQENWVGYSEWTIEGFEIDTFKLGGHNILEILKSLEGKYIYFVMDRVECGE